MEKPITGADKSATLSGLTQAEPALDESSIAPALGDILRLQARERPDAIAYEFEGRQISFADMRDRVFAVGNALRAAGLQPGDRVAVLAKNSGIFVELLFGAACIGVVFVPLNWRLSPAEIAYIIDDAKPRILFVGEQFGELALAALASIATPPLVVRLDEMPCAAFEEWRGNRSADPGIAVSPGDVAIQMYTSGTTGRPKGALLSHHALNIVRVTQPAEADWSHWTDGEASLIAMPLFHIGGIGSVLAAICNGVRIHLLAEFNVERVFELLGQGGITRLFLVPSAIRIMLDDPRSRAVDYSRLRYVFYGASPMSAALMQEARSVFGCGFVQLYGMTETSGSIVALTEADHDTKSGRAGAVGRPLRGVEIAIVNEADEPVSIGVMGEIIIRSAANMAGYWNQPEQTEQSFLPGGWLRSGDAGYIDADGFLHVRDRVKDMIISGGENVYPAEVETVLAEHEAVAEVGVIGVPDERWGEVVMAFVVPADGATVDVEALRSWLRPRLAAFKMPKSIRLADALPKNASGKLLRRELRELYRKDHRA